MAAIPCKTLTENSMAAVPSEASSNDEARLPKVPAILRVDTKTGPQISDSRRQRLTPHRVQLPSPQIDPYRGQTEDTRLVSAASHGSLKQLYGLHYRASIYAK
ncbi:uncharacterized protein [Miscanthus floridulus]|uniref:uncharacterized protein isoform X1 n=1 Tax=Miscanthus floridulus TaxID=154761 RepID=UPI00345777AB